MFAKEKISIGLLILVFLFTATMFVYQNFISDKVNQVEMEYVLVAKEDIVKGDQFTTDNVGKMAMPVNNILPTYITSFEELEKKVSNSTILKNEIISEARVVEQDTDETYSVIVTPQNKIQVEKGESVNIYVQLTQEIQEDDEKVRKYETYELARNKVIKNVIKSTNSSGLVDENGIEGIELHMTEDESMAYYKAEYLKDLKAKIIVVPYKDVLSESEGVSNQILEAQPFTNFLENQ